MTKESVFAERFIKCILFSLRSGAQDVFPPGDLEVLKRFRNGVAVEG
jgi:hypothetical protein